MVAAAFRRGNRDFAPMRQRPQEALLTGAKTGFHKETTADSRIGY